MAPDAAFLPVFRETGEPLGDPEAFGRRAGALSGPFSTIVEKPYRAPSGDPRDYVSLSIYWWPNPITRIPYIQRDGRRNPEAEAYDAPRLHRVLDEIGVLARAYALTREPAFREAAEARLGAWFADPGTRMNPHLTYAQMMPGWASGGRQGIIEGIPLGMSLPDSLAILEEAGGLSDENRRACREWLGCYLTWLLESRPGRVEGSRRNNHGTWYDAQVAALALSLGLTPLAEETVRGSLARIEHQFLADGRQPAELRRTKSFEYSVYNLDGWLHVARIGQRLGIEVWRHRGPSGGSPEAGLAYLREHVDSWPHRQIYAIDPEAVGRLSARVPPPVR